MKSECRRPGSAAAQARVAERGEDLRQIICYSRTAFSNEVFKRASAEALVAYGPGPGQDTINIGERSDEV